MNDIINLARRAVAAGWRWQAGALDTIGYRVADVDAKGIPCAWTYTDGLFPACAGLNRQRAIACVVDWSVPCVCGAEPKSTSFWTRRIGCSLRVRG